MRKSGSVSRQRPRSSPTTLRPDSASSFARIVPVRPAPTITASTGLSRVAMSVLSTQQHMLRMAVVVGLGAPFEHVEDRHRLAVVPHAVLVDKSPIDPRDAPEADHLPPDPVAVPPATRLPHTP